MRASQNELRVTAPLPSPRLEAFLEMLAADEFCPEDADALRATGFLVRNFKLLSRERWLDRLGSPIDRGSRAEKIMTAPF